MVGRTRKEREGKEREREGDGEEQSSGVGGTGYLGRRIVNASLAAGHPTFVLHRPESAWMWRRGSFSDHGSLVAVVRQVDAVVCPIAGVHLRSHQIPLQLKLVEAMKEAGNVNHRMSASTTRWRLRRAVEGPEFPSPTSAGCFAGYFAGGLCEPGRILPAKERVTILGSGDVKAIFVDEDDVAAYANKTVYIRPPENVLSQLELVRIWEDLIGRQLDKLSLSVDDLFTAMKVGMGRYYHVFYEGCLTNFEVAEEASQLYPEVPYTRMRDYLKRYL
ncbi:unnamed protein product [Spirodela intermedia]|uniref:NmrA-like domain-containing protein n=1 Tax=Spirodela intermedia TaxID=51605 RepID=A0A7I8INY7_SPIIN|nr:unnamed protein product [Spirodela intermedia]CAA6659183.1 unnamed protein product [Spirodela intermedia]